MGLLCIDKAVSFIEHKAWERLWHDMTWQFTIFYWSNIIHLWSDRNMGCAVTCWNGWTGLSHRPTQLHGISWGGQDPNRERKVWMNAQFICETWLQKQSRCLSHLCGVCTGGYVTDHKAAAPPRGCVWVTSMDKESIMNLRKKHFYLPLYCTNYCWN